MRGFTWKSTLGFGERGGGHDVHKGLHLEEDTGIWGKGCRWQCPWGASPRSGCWDLGKRCRTVSMGDFTWERTLGPGEGLQGMGGPCWPTAG